MPQETEENNEAVNADAKRPVQQRVMPAPGQKWRQKRVKSRIAVVNVAEIISLEDERGYIYLQMPWTQNGVGGKGLDTFLKQYEFLEA